MLFFDAPILHFVKTAINHYLGPFLTDELTVKQLSFQNGQSSIENVDLNVVKLNEILEGQKIPIEVIEGYIRLIRFTVPLKTIFQDSVIIEVVGLDISVKPINRMSNVFTESSMVDSMYNSLVTSMSHVKEDCLRAADNDQKPIGQAGRVSLANAIDSIISRIKLSIEDVNIRLETNSSPFGVAMELHAKRIEYFDDQVEMVNSAPRSPEQASSPSSGGILSYFSSSSPNTKPPPQMQYTPVASFKNITIYGVSLHLEEFSASRPQTPHQDDLDTSGFFPCHEDSFHSMRETFSESLPKLEEKPPETQEEAVASGGLPNLVQIAAFGGKQSIRFRLNQSLSIGDTPIDLNSSDPHVEASINVGVCHFFMAPGQIHAITKLIQSYTGCISSNDESKIKQSNLQSFPARAHDSHPPPFSENRPMTESDFARCDLSASPPGPIMEASVPDMDLFQSAVGHLRTLPDHDDADSVTTMFSDTAASDITSTATVGAGRHFEPTSSQGQTPSETTGPAIPGSSFGPKSHWRNERSSGSSFINDLSAFKLHIGIVTFTLLHEEPRASPGEQALDPSVTAHSKLANNANAFFQKLGTGSRFFSSDELLETIRKRLASICTQDHLSLIAKTVNFTSSSKENSRSGMVHLDCRLSVKDLELIEVLFERKNAREKMLLLPNDNEPTFVELLIFARPNATESLPNFVVTWESQRRQRSSKIPSRRARPSHSSGADRRSTPSSKLHVTVASFSSEIDPSLVDRINDLLQSNSRFEFDTGGSQPWNAMRSLDEDDDANQIAIHFTAPSAFIHLRFPVPDLRQDQVRVPWWRRNLRKDFLRFELAVVAGHTVLGSTSEPCAQYELTCKQIIGLYCELDREPLIVFRTTDSNADGNLMDLGHGIHFPRIVVKIAAAATSQLFGDPLDTSSAHLYGSSGDQSDSINDSLERELLATTKTPGSSPFSHRQSFVSESNEEQTRPGCNKEMEEFLSRASKNTRISLQLAFPCLWLNLHDKDVLTALYNRLACDLVLWTPSAPSLSPTNFGSIGTAGACGPQSLLNQLHDTIHCMPIASGFEEGKAFRFRREDRGDLSDDEDSDKFSSANTFNDQTGGASRNRISQSDFFFHITVDRLHLASKVPAKIADDSFAKDYSGLAKLDVHKGRLFFVSGFEGDPTLAYLAVQLWNVALHHNGHVDTSETPQLDIEVPTIERTDGGLLSAIFPHSPQTSLGGQDEPMLSIAMRIIDSSLQSDTGSPSKRIGYGKPQKITTLAIGISAATLHHRMTPVGEEWITQLMGLVDIPDPPINGFVATPSVTATHVFLDRCLIDYKPINLQARALLAFEELYLSTNAVLETDTTVLNLDAQELALFLSIKSESIDLVADYVCIMDMGLLRLQLTYSEAKATKQPRFDLFVSNNMAHVRTCADSGSLFIQLVEHLVTFGDLPREAAMVAAATMSTNSGAVSTKPALVAENVQISEQSLLVNEELSHKINSQIADALREDSPDLPAHPAQEASSSSDDDFVLVDVPACVDPAKARLQELDELNSQGAVIQVDSSGTSLRFKEDHFESQPTLGDFDPLSDPTGMQCPVERYTVREFCLVWYLYAGSDFNTSGSAKALLAAGAAPPTFCDSPKPTRAAAAASESPLLSMTPSEGSVRYTKPRSEQKSTRVGKPAATTRLAGLRERGGPGRQLDTCMEFAISKLRFRHSIYDEQDYHALRQVFIVQELEIRDRLATSNFNQFLYLYNSPERPHFDNEPMLSVTLQHVRPELPVQRTQECLMKIAVQPIRLNIDQDTVIFLRNYVALTEYYLTHGIGDRRSLSNSSGSSRRSSISLNSPIGQSPVMQPGGAVMASVSDSRVGAVRFDEMSEGSSPGATRVRSISDEAEVSQPVYFREVIIQPTIYIKMDYHGKRLDFGEKHLFTVLAAFLVQLNDCEFQLKALHCRRGLLGWQKVFEFVYNEWTNDIMTRQWPNIFSGVGPMTAIVQLGAAFRDLVWVPVQRSRSDGQFLHGFQVGAKSFSRLTMDAIFSLCIQFISVVHRAAETSYDLLSPGPSLRTRYPQIRRPADLREGVQGAAIALRRGVDTVVMDMTAATRTDEEKGYAGSVGSFFRQCPPAALVPIVATTEAVQNLVGGVRSHLRPETKREDERKYKK